MGYTRKSFADRAAAQFRSLRIDDGPNGAIEIRSILNVSDEKAEQATELAAKLDALDDSKAKPKDLIGTATDYLCVLADKPEDLRIYLEDFSTGEVIALLKVHAEKTQGAEGK